MYDLTVSYIPHGDKLIPLKAIREMTSLGLRESKDFLDNVLGGQPRLLVKGLSLEDILPFVYKVQELGWGFELHGWESPIYGCCGASIPGPYLMSLIMDEEDVEA